MESKDWLKAGAIVLLALLVAAAVRYFWLKRKQFIPKPSPVASLQLKPTFQMKQIDGHSIPFENDLPYPTGEAQKRETLALNGDWKKMRTPGDHKLSLSDRNAQNIALLKRENPEAAQTDFDDHAWQSCKIPGVENPPPDRYMDVTWYRREFQLPAAFSGKRAILTFGAANYVADVWLNGEWIGYHEGGFTPFSFDVTNKLKAGKDNLVTVRVDNIPWLPQKTDSGKNQPPANNSDIVPYKTCDWWNYGGLLREVELEALEPQSIFRVDVRPKWAGGKTDLDVTVVTGNTTGKKSPYEVRFKIYPAQVTENNLTARCARDIADINHTIAFQGGTKPASEFSGQPFDAASFNLSCPELQPWELRRPNLYVLETELVQFGKTLDTFYTQFGVRNVSADSSHFLVNGKPEFMRGVAAHETFPGSDPHQPPTIEEVLRQDFQNIYDLNINFVRTGHRPVHPLTLLMADRLGIGIWEEIPVYWFAYKQFDYQRTERPIARQMFLEMLARDLNRPSILVWGTCNECEAQKERSEFIRDLRDNGRKFDTSRLIAQSAAGSDAFDKTQQECDFSGFTSYYGVFYGYNYGPATEKALEAMRAANPAKTMMATEFGIWSEKDLSNSDNQIKVARETYEAFAKKPYVCGAIWWALNDWHTMITDPQSMGLVTFKGLKKPAYYVLQELYAAREGKTFLKWYNPRQDRPIRGSLDVDLEMVSPSPFKSLTVELDGLRLAVTHIDENGRFKFNVNSKELSEGDHKLFTRAENQAGTVLSQERTLFVDNIDEMPSMVLNLKSGDSVMDEQVLHVEASDDRGIQKLQLNVDDQPWQTVEPLYSPSTFVKTLNFDASKPVDGHKVHIKLTDSGGHTKEAVLSLTLAEKSHGQYLDLPFTKDWISSSDNLNDGTGWDYPAEELPLSNKPFIFNSKTGPISFRFPDTSAGAKNCVSCRGQKIVFPKGEYKAIHILGAMHDGSAPVAFQLTYEKGLPRTVMLNFSDWWRADPIWGEEAVVKTTFHHEKGDPQKQPGVGIYLQTIPFKEGQPVSLTLPNDDRLEIFAITLEKQERP